MPDNWLTATSRPEREGRRHNEDGMPPNRALLARTKVVTEVRFPTQGEMLPVILLSSKLRKFKEERLVILVGMPPVRLFDLRTNTMS